MCRIAFFPPEPNFPRPTVVKMLVELEKSKGGQGNGFYFFGGDHIYKSVTMPINKLIKKGAWKHGFLFHSRLATHGAKSRRNTHPFRLDKGEVIVHNGIWSDYKTVLPFCNPRSDTDSEVLGYYFQRNGYKEFPTSYGGNAILMRITIDGRVKVVAGKQFSGNLVVLQKGDYAWIASEPPSDKTLYDSVMDIKEGVHIFEPSVEGIKSIPTVHYFQTYAYIAPNYSKYDEELYDDNKYIQQQLPAGKVLKIKGKLQPIQPFWGWGA